MIQYILMNIIQQAGPPGRYLTNKPMTQYAVIITKREALTNRQ